MTEMNESCTKKKSIMIDMDDTMMDCDFLFLLEDFIGHSIDLTKCKDFYLQDMLGDKKAEFFKNWGEVNLYEKAELYSECFEVLKALNEVYEIYIVTDFIWREAIEEAGSNAKNKYECLRKLVPFINPWHYIFTGDKSIIATDIKIDDKMCNLKNADMKLMYTAYHNVDMDDSVLKANGVIRVDSWRAIGELLL